MDPGRGFTRSEAFVNSRSILARMEGKIWKRSNRLRRTSVEARRDGWVICGCRAGISRGQDIGGLSPAPWQRHIHTPAAFGVALASVVEVDHQGFAPSVYCHSLIPLQCLSSILTGP
jgi:hypothetical protein